MADSLAAHFKFKLKELSPSPHKEWHGPTTARTPTPPHWHPLPRGLPLPLPIHQPECQCQVQAGCRVQASTGRQMESRPAGPGSDQVLAGPRPVSPAPQKAAGPCDHPGAHCHPTTQPPNHPTTQPPNHPTTQPPNHPRPRAHGSLRAQPHHPRLLGVPPTHSHTPRGGKPPPPPPTLRLSAACWWKSP